MQGRDTNRDVPNFLIATASVAVLYFVLAKIGQTLAIPPGNVTPVWLPSGVMLALALVYGTRIAAGVFLGAFVGNAWSYFDPSSLDIVIRSLLAASMNGIGDVLSTVGAAHLINKLSKSKPFSSNVSLVTRFIVVGAVLGSLASAVFGVTGLLVGGFIGGGDFTYMFLTWLTGDAVGVLVMAPIVYALIQRKWQIYPSDASIGMVLHFVALLCVAFLIYSSDQTIVRTLAMVSVPPLLIWSSYNYKQRYVYASMAVFCALVITITALGSGPFTEASLNENLINLQLFIGALTTTVLFATAGNKDRREAYALLEEERLGLEQKVDERTQDLSLALKQRDTLIQEVHHRVKNNLQVILSMLSIQKRSAQGPHEVESLEQSNRRIRVMAKLYEHLYQSDDVSEIDAQEYFLEVANDALMVTGATEAVAMEISCDETTLDIKVATTCAQIISELVSNCLKHAFPDEQGSIAVSLRRLDRNVLCLSVSDDGVGLPDDFDEKKLKSLGIKLVNALVTQLGGTKQVNSDNGTTIEITFPEKM